MSESFQCGNVDALMGYLYDEASPEQQRAVALHLARCAACAAEIDGLNATRQELDTWRPPAMALGFRIAAAPEPVAPIAVAPWWQRPMPAWMQAAAAVVVFAAGLAAGTARQAPSVAAVSGAGGRTASPVVATAGPAASNTVSRSELASLEQRLRSEMNAIRTVAAPRIDAAGGSEEAVVRRVQALVQESEQRQRRELVLRTAELFRDFEMQRRQDMVNVQQSIRQVEGITGAEFRQQREMWNELTNRVSQPGVGR
jgi:anti-sigma factor RsiW